MTLALVRDLARGAHLDVFGVVTAGSLPQGASSLVLLGPHEPGYWDYVRNEPEFQDGEPDPIDRWSLRAIGNLASALQGEALFPFGGPPYHPFIQWATSSGRCWQSPVGLLVHDVAGLMVSYRGAIALPHAIEPQVGANPCDTCTDRPCLSACPVGALGRDQIYDVPSCKHFVLSEAGHDCRENGCIVRRACPVSKSYGRVEEQSAHHMRYFAR